MSPCLDIGVQTNPDLAAHASYLRKMLPGRGGGDIPNLANGVLSFDAIYSYVKDSDRSRRY